MHCPMLYERLGTVVDGVLSQVPVLPSSAMINVRAQSQKHRKGKVPQQLQGGEDHTRDGVFKDVLVDKWFLD